MNINKAERIVDIVNEIKSLKNVIEDLERERESGRIILYYNDMADHPMNYYLCKDASNALIHFLKNKLKDSEVKLEDM